MRVGRSQGCCSSAMPRLPQTASTAAVFQARGHGVGCVHRGMLLRGMLQKTIFPSFPFSCLGLFLCHPTKEKENVKKCRNWEYFQKRKRKEDEWRRRMHVYLNQERGRKSATEKNKVGTMSTNRLSFRENERRMTKSLINFSSVDRHHSLAAWVFSDSGATTGAYSDAYSSREYFFVFLFFLAERDAGHSGFFKQNGVWEGKEDGKLWTNSRRRKTKTYLLFHHFIFYTLLLPPNPAFWTLLWLPCFSFFKPLFCSLRFSRYCRCHPVLQKNLTPCRAVSEPENTCALPRLTSTASAFCSTSGSISWNSEVSKRKI